MAAQSLKNRVFKITDDSPNDKFVNLMNKTRRKLEKTELLQKVNEKLMQGRIYFIY